MKFLRERLITIVAVIFAMVAATLVVESPMGVHWSADCSAKYLAVLSLRYDGTLHYDVPYAGRHFDPGLRAIPIGESYYDLRHGEIHISWPELFPILVWPFHRMMGWYGLFVIPVAGGALAVYLAGKSAEKIRPGSGWIASVLTSIATPVLVYASLFWEHTPAVALMLGATWLALQYLQDQKWRWLFAGAACIGLAAAGFRTDANLFFASWVGALFLVLRGNRRLIAVPVTLVGFVFGALPASTLNWITNGKILAANTTKNTPPPSLAYLLKAKWATLPHFFGGTTVPPYDSWIVIAGVCAVVATYYFGKGRARAATFLIAALAVTWASLDALRVVLSLFPFDAHGWLVMSPVLALGFLFSPSIIGQPQRRARLFVLMLALLICIVNFAALVAAYPNGWAADGNHEWGPRYWLILFPVLAISAAVNWDAVFLRAVRSERAVIGVGVAAMLAASIAFEVGGIGGVRFCERDTEGIKRLFESRGDTPLVTDLFHLSSLSPSQFFARPSFYVKHHEVAAFRAWAGPAFALGLTRFDLAIFGDPKTNLFLANPPDGWRFVVEGVESSRDLRLVQVRALPLDAGDRQR